MRYLQRVRFMRLPTCAGVCASPSLWPASSKRYATAWKRCIPMRTSHFEHDYEDLSSPTAFSLCNTLLHVPSLCSVGTACL